MKFVPFQKVLENQNKYIFTISDSGILPEEITFYDSLTEVYCDFQTYFKNNRDAVIFVGYKVKFTEAFKGKQRFEDFLDYVEDITGHDYSEYFEGYKDEFVNLFDNWMKHFERDYYWDDTVGILDIKELYDYFSNKFSIMTEKQTTEKNYTISENMMMSLLFQQELLNAVFNENPRLKLEYVNGITGEVDEKIVKKAQEKLEVYKKLKV